MLSLQLKQSCIEHEPEESHKVCSLEELSLSLVVLPSEQVVSGLAMATVHV